MNKSDNIGKLMHLPLADIEPIETLSEADFVITAAVEAVLQADGRNWVPVIVQEIGDYQYKVVSNHLVYAVAQQANLERVWCIVIEPTTVNIEQAKILSQEVSPKVNLSIASQEMIQAALEYLNKKQPSTVKAVVDAADTIAQANRKLWSDFSPVAKLKSKTTGKTLGITGKKLELLATVFYLSPPPPPPPLPDPVSLKRASRDEIFERLHYLSTYQIGGFEAINPEPATDAIFNANKGKWKTISPISKLGCGITTTHVKTLKTLFTV